MRNDSDTYMWLWIYKHMFTSMKMININEIITSIKINMCYGRSVDTHGLNYAHNILYKKHSGKNK